MSATRPRVSIGLPVRNGQNYLCEALDSLLGQTFSDFEIIISDNASTDNTPNICREYLARDPQRVRYHRHASDVGPSANFNGTFAMARGQYFRWHAHDDVCRPEYLEKCVEVLDRDPTVVLAYPRTLVIDEKGRPLSSYDFKLDTDSRLAARRFAELVLVNHRQHRAVEIFGLMRASALRHTPLQGSYARADSVLLVRLALLGRFVEISERLFLSRSHAAQSMQTLPAHCRNGSARLTRLLGTGPLPPPEWWDRSRAGRLNFPEWHLLKEYWRSIGAGPLGALERAWCYGVLVQWTATNLPKLARDVIFGADTVAHRGARRQATRSGAPSALSEACGRAAPAQSQITTWSTIAYVRRTAAGARLVTSRGSGRGSATPLRTHQR